MRLNESKYFFNVTLCLFSSLSADGARGRKRQREKKRRGESERRTEEEEEKLISLHVRPLGYPATYGGYSRVHSRISNARALRAPGHDPNLDVIVDERAAGVSLRQNGQTNVFHFRTAEIDSEGSGGKKEPDGSRMELESRGVDARFTRARARGRTGLGV